MRKRSVDSSVLMRSESVTFNAHNEIAPTAIWPGSYSACSCEPVLNPLAEENLTGVALLVGTKVRLLEVFVGQADRKRMRSCRPALSGADFFTRCRGRLPQARRTGWAGGTIRRFEGFSGSSAMRRWRSVVRLWDLAGLLGTSAVFPVLTSHEADSSI